MSSTHEVPIVEVKLEKHPNADSLSLVRLWGFTCVVRTADWKDGALAAYIPPDYTVPVDRPEFTFLKRADKARERERITVKKLRGVVSMGLLVPAPVGSAVGDDVMAALGVERYEPPISAKTGGEAIKGPAIVAPRYDLESWRRYGAETFIPGERVRITCKLHGASARYVHHAGVLHVGSHGEWKREDESILWWAALKQNEWMRTLCEANPSHTFYAEVFGQVQDLRYGTERGEFRIAVFDILAPDGKWLSPEERDVLLGEPIKPYVAPLVFDGPYDPAEVEALAEGPSLVPGADHIREGIVIEAHEQRYVEALGGRAKLKLVSNGYLERK